MIYLYGFNNKLQREPSGPSAKVDLKQFFPVADLNLANDVQVDGGLNIDARAIPLCEKDGDIQEDTYVIEPESSGDEDDMVQNGEGVEAVEVTMRRTRLPPSRHQDADAETPTLPVPQLVLQPPQKTLLRMLPTERPPIKLALVVLLLVRLVLMRWECRFDLMVFGVEEVV